MSDTGSVRSSEYQCSSCGEEYTFSEFRDLDRAPIDPSEEDPEQGQGYSRVCECGHQFFVDDFQAVTEVEHAGDEFRLSTTHLALNHGHGEKDLWFESCVFWDGSSRVLDRYETQDEAEDGHQDIVEKLKAGEYAFRDESPPTFELEGDE